MDLELPVKLYSSQSILLKKDVIGKGRKETKIDISQFQSGQYFLKVGAVVKRFEVAK